MAAGKAWGKNIVATIQLGQEILAVEALIDERDHDAAFRQLVHLRDKFGRRPEFRYLQALFDATFGVRPDKELLREVTALVAEQPDFSEAVALLAWLYDRVGDRNRAEVFAREALHAVNPRAQARAQRVLDPHAAAVAQGHPPSPTLELESPHAPSEPKMPPVYVPSASSPPARTRTAADASGYDPMLQARAPTPVPAPTQPGSRVPTPPVPAAPVSQAPTALPPLVGTSPGFAPPTAAMIESAQSGAAAPPHPLNPDDGLPPLETIPFSPAGAMPPPPSIPPEALSFQRLAADREALGLRTERQRTEDIPRTRVPTPPPPHRPTPPPQRPLTAPPLRQLTPAPPDTGFDRGEPVTADHRHKPSRSAIAIPPPVEVQRHWFKYARAHQVSSEGSDSTGLMLLDLAERVVEGRTPLTSDPVPLDRRGLIAVEQCLEPYRNARGSVSAAERAATTSAAAFLLAVLMKESDARAVDTSPEDGACKAVLPSGASVRPLLIAASFARGRGPGLVESFDRAATAHMQRTPRSVTQRQPPIEHQQSVNESEQQTAPIGQGRRITRRAALSVMRRELDAGTVCLVDPGAAMSTPVPVNLRLVADEFWDSAEGREIGGSSRRVGSFSLADIDALERHVTRSLPLVGLSPPGAPWPWVPSDDQDKQIYVWGAILGEVLNSVYSGHWEIDPAEPRDRLLFRVVLAGSVIAWPMAKVYLRMARGVTHDLSAYVDVLGRIVGRQATRGM